MKNKRKKQYIIPQIELIILDTDISLALESDPPYPGNEGCLTPQYFNVNPFDHQNG